MSAALKQGFGDHEVPTFRRSEAPETVRSLLLVYLRLRDAAHRVRKDYAAEGALLEERWAAARVVAYLDACVEACESWLAVTARRGGRGLPPPAVQP